MPLRVSPEKKEEKERIARALLRATLRLSREHGFASLGLREVARAAEIAPTSFYRHFPDMEQLGLSLIDQLVGELVEGWIEKAKESRADPGGPLRAISKSALDGAGADPELIHFLVAERVGAIASFRRAIADRLSPLSKAILDAFGAEGLKADPVVLVDLADGAISLLMEACGQALDQEVEGRVELRERWQRQVRLMLRGATKDNS
jgi:AcrR family transcriptional regulator